MPLRGQDPRLRNDQLPLRAPAHALRLRLLRHIVARRPRTVHAWPQHFILFAQFLPRAGILQRGHRTNPLPFAFVKTPSIANAPEVLDGAALAGDQLLLPRCGQQVLTAGVGHVDGGLLRLRGVPRLERAEHGAAALDLLLVRLWVD